jgi:hypothetical protein
MFHQFFGVNGHLVPILIIRRWRTSQWLEILDYRFGSEKNQKSQIENPK